MKYQKPKITFLGEAEQAIQGSNRKLLTLLIDSRNIAYLTTLMAYEADE